MPTDLSPETETSSSLWRRVSDLVAQRDRGDLEIRGIKSRLHGCLYLAELIATRVGGSSVPKVDAARVRDYIKDNRGLVAVPEQCDAAVELIDRRYFA
mgnify:CR=1 FL=1